MTMFNASPYQQDIWRHFSTEPRDLAVIARAGSGKTTTIIHGLHHLPPGRVLLCAFNTEIKNELLRRVQDLHMRHVKVLSLHGLGLATVKRYPEYANAEMEEKKGLRMAREAVGYDAEEEDEDQRLYMSSLADSVRQTASLVKSTLCTSREDLIEMIEEFNIDLLDITVDALAAYVRKACILAIDDKMHYDFDDMIWLPCVLNLQPPQYDFVIVDECQDMCLAQLRLAQAARKPGGKIIVVGDPKQAIYAWRGADANAIPRMIEDLKADVLPLTVSYRCPQKVIAIARKYVSDIESAQGAPEGEVHENVDVTDVPRLVRPGDYILSRANAPLVSVCTSLLRRGIPSRIIGRDISAVIRGYVRKSRAKSIQGLLAWIDEKKASERERLKKKPAVLENVLDFLDVLENIAEDEPDLAGVERRLDALFLDEQTDQSRLVACATVHKAKGKERDNVFLLHETFFRRPGAEEENVFYVGVTRARKRLYLVEGLYADARRPDQESLW